jgi:hypothetical protein
MDAQDLGGSHGAWGLKLRLKVFSAPKGLENKIHSLGALERPDESSSGEFGFCVPESVGFGMKDEHEREVSL